MTSFNLNYFLKALFSNTGTLGTRLQPMNLGAHNSVQNRWHAGWRPLDPFQGGYVKMLGSLRNASLPKCGSRSTDATAQTKTNMGQAAGVPLGRNLLAASLVCPAGGMAVERHCSL